MKIKYSLKDIKKTVHPKAPWLAVLVYDPISIRLVWLIANFTKITPNQITIFGFLIGLSSAWCFFHGTHFYLILGVLLFGFSTILDWTDGKLARLRKFESRFGRYLDSITDQIRNFFIVLCLVYGQYLLTGDFLYFLFGMVYNFFYLTHWISGYEIYAIKNEFPREDISLNHTSTVQNKFSFVWKIKAYFESKQISVLPTFAEADALAFFIFPILMKIKLGLLLGSIILFFNILIGAIYFFKIKCKK